MILLRFDHFFHTISSIKITFFGGKYIVFEAENLLTWFFFWNFVKLLLNLFNVWTGRKLLETYRILARVFQCNILFAIIQFLEKKVIIL